MLRWIVLVLSLVFSVAQAQSLNNETNVNDSNFTEGKEYKLLPENRTPSATAKALAETSPDKVQVISFFSYGCPVCNRMDPEIEKWNRSKEETQMVSFVDVPVAWGHPGWDNLARAYYIAEAAGVLEDAHPKIFRAVHQQGKQFKTQKQVEEFFITELGVPREKFNELYDSFHVRRRMKQGELLLQDYGIRSIPAFIVADKYYVDVQTAGGVQQTVQVLDFLVNKEAFYEGAEEISFEEVSDGIDHSEDDTILLENIQSDKTMEPSTAPQ